MGQARDQAGNIWETDANGNPTRLLQAASGERQGRVVAPPQSAKDTATTAKTYQEIQNDRARLDLDQKNFIQKQNEFAAQMLKDGFVKNADGQWVRDPNFKPAPTSAEVTVDRNRLKQLNVLVGQINRVQDLYNQNIAPEPNGWLSSLGDYLPTSVNDQFNTAGAQLSEKGLAAFRIPGQGTQSDRDALMFDRANLPKSSTKDLSIEEQLRGVRERVEEEYKSFGLEPPKWSGLGNTENRDADPAAPVVTNNGSNGTGPQMGLAQGEAFSTPDDIARAELMNKALSRPGVTLDDLVNTARSYGGRVTMQEIGEFNRLLEAKKQGHNVSFIPYASGRRNPISVAAGNILTSPLGTATATAVSGLGFNLLDAALPEQMQALRQLNPNAAAIGDIGGAIGGTMALSKLVRTATEKGLSRFAPNAANRLLSNSGRANLARNVATDTAYGTAYGANVDDNATLGGASAAVGSLGGNLAGRIIGAGIGGINRTPFAQYLKDHGIDLTIGQQMGGTAKRLEDAAMSIPGPGDMIIARQQDSIRGLNEAAFREVGVTGYGDDAMEALGRNRQQAYTDAVAGRQYDLNDPQTVQDMQAALAARDGLAPDYASKFDIAVQNRIAGTPIGQTGQMTGEQYQQAMRGLNDYKNVQGASGFENDYRNAIGGVQSALRGVVERQTPEVIPALQQADQLYRSEKILQDALNRNRKDASGIGTDLFRPSDLTEAVFQNSKEYGGEAPFFELGRAAQNVIPSKLPDSGTVRRGLLAALGTGGVLGAANGADGENASFADMVSGIITGGAAGGMSALGIAALLSLGGTKAGQKALTKTLMERPQTLQNFGAAIRKHQGLFGTAAVPLVIEASQ